MINLYGLNDCRLAPATIAESQNIPADAVWIDLLNPTPEEAKAVSDLTGATIPSQDDLSVVSDTDRLYRENGIIYVAITVITRSGTDHPDIADIGFILAGQRLITVRYADPTPVSKFAGTYARQRCIAGSNLGIFIGLLESFVNRLGEHVEANGAVLYDISGEIFGRKKKGPLDTPQLQGMLERLGRAGDVNAKARDSLVSIGRMQAFITEELSSIHDQAMDATFTAIQRDVQAISDYANFVAGQLTFVLEAVLGLISIDQNRVVKIFSVLAMIFLPPTLIATVYGMNFDFMPELSSRYGYPLVLLAMVVSAVGPYFYFRWKRWL
jgi:magnesium transporter